MLMKIARIVSGGQTGADRAGLDAAQEVGLSCGGWCPKGRRAEDGFVPKRYPLKEARAGNYLVRTEKNVIDSDGTILFTYGRATGGSKRTIAFARKHRKALKHIDLNNNNATIVTLILNWLATSHTDGLTVNVAGSRKSKAPRIEQRVKDILLQVFEENRSQ